MGLRAVVACTALVAGACAGTGDSAPGTTVTTIAAVATEDGETATSAAESATTVDATSTAPAASIVWSRIPHDEAIFGGEEDQIMASVTAGGSGLVAVGWDVALRAAAVWSSPDGTVWSRVPHDEAVFGGQGDQFITSVTAGGPGLVAVGIDSPGIDRFAAVWTSADGLAWSRVPHSTIFAGADDWASMQSVTAGGPGLIAVGQDGFDDPNAAVWTSPDGLVWSQVPHSDVFGVDGMAEGMNSVAAGGPGLVAVGREGDVPFGGEDRNAAVWTSTDGINWSRVPHDEAVFGGDAWQEMSLVTTGGPGLVAIGAPTVWTSSDGVSWSRVSPEESVFGEGVIHVHDVIHTGTQLVAVGYEFSGGAEGERDAAVWTSTDGITWSRIPHDEERLGGVDDQEMMSLAVGGPGLVAVGTSGQIFPGDLDAAAWVAGG